MWTLKRTVTELNWSDGKYDIRCETTHHIKGTHLRPLSLGCRSGKTTVVPSVADRKWLRQMEITSLCGCTMLDFSTFKPQTVSEDVSEIYKREAKTSGLPSGGWLKNCSNALFLIGQRVQMTQKTSQRQDGSAPADILASVLYSVEIRVGMSWLWRKHF